MVVHRSRRHTSRPAGHTAGTRWDVCAGRQSSLPIVGAHERAAEVHQDDHPLAAGEPAASSDGNIPDRTRHVSLDRLIAGGIPRPECFRASSAPGRRVVSGGATVPSKEGRRAIGRVWRARLPPWMSPESSVATMKIVVISSDARAFPSRSTPRPSWPGRRARRERPGRGRSPRLRGSSEARAPAAPLP